MIEKTKPIRLLCEDSGTRLDVWLANKLDGFSRSGIQSLIMDGRIFINGERAIKNYKTKAGDTVFFDPPSPRPVGFAAQDIKLNIVFEDDYIAVVDKPRGMVVHPGNGNRDGTLANALAHHCAGGLSDIGGIARPGIVHRLDKDTSGLIVAAKTNEAHIKLAAAFKDRRVRKIYNAVVMGNVIEDFGKIDMPIGRHKNDRKRMAVLADGGRQAITLFKVISRLPCAMTWLELELITGRTHQIRVHLARIGHPVVGDPIYGRGGAAWGGGGIVVSGTNDRNDNGDNSESNSGNDNGDNSGNNSECNSGMLLHATILEFDHPITAEPLFFKSDPPKYFPKLI